MLLQTCAGILNGVSGTGHVLGTPLQFRATLHETANSPWDASDAGIHSGAGGCTRTSAWSSCALRTLALHLAGYTANDANTK